MASINKRVVSKAPVTHNGGQADRISNYEALKRSVMTAMLGENSFYESGESLKVRIMELSKKVDAMKVAELAVDARENGKLRHVPLWLAVCLARRSKEIKIAPLLARIIRRPDEMGEFLALLKEANGSEVRKPSGGIKLPAQVRKGLAAAFAGFNEYQLAKWKGEKDQIRLIDVLRMVRPVPDNEDMAALWKRLKDGKLAPPDTWERRLSAGEKKEKVWTDLLNAPKDKGLGYMALLMNLRNMKNAGVPKDLVAGQLIPRARKSWALPFRFISARDAVPEWKDIIDLAMQESVKGLPRLMGKTVLLVDLSGSMVGPLVGKSKLDRRDAACALGILVDGVCENAAIYGFSTNIALAKGPKKNANLAGFELFDAIQRSNSGGTKVGYCVEAAIRENPDADRIIVITDEQSSDRVSSPKMRGYMVNVASYQNGVGYGGNWTHINGFSENVLSFISALENGVITGTEDEEE